MRGPRAELTACRRLALPDGRKGRLTSSMSGTELPVRERGQGAGVDGRPVGKSAATLPLADVYADIALDAGAAYRSAPRPTGAGDAG